MQEDELEYKNMERYILGHMTQAERVTFENRMKNDADFREKVALHTALYSLKDDDEWLEFDGDPEILKKEVAQFRSEDTQRFKKHLKEFAAKENTTVDGKRPWLNRSLWGAIAAILVIALFVFYPKPPNLPGLYEEYRNWETLPSLITKGDAQNQLKEIEYRFRSQDFKGVIAIGDSISFPADGTYGQARLYMGAAHLELGQYEQALAYFDDLAESNSLDFHKGYWYKVLTYLKQDKREESIAVLEIIASNPTYFGHEEALKLLKKLR